MPLVTRAGEGKHGIQGRRDRGIAAAAAGGAAGGNQVAEACIALQGNDGGGRVTGRHRGAQGSDMSKLEGRRGGWEATSSGAVEIESDGEDRIPGGLSTQPAGRERDGYPVDSCDRLEADGHGREEEGSDSDSEYQMVWSQSQGDIVERFDPDGVDCSNRLRAQSRSGGNGDAHGERLTESNGVQEGSVCPGGMQAGTGERGRAIERDARGNGTQGRSADVLRGVEVRDRVGERDKGDSRTACRGGSRNPKPAGRGNNGVADSLSEAWETIAGLNRVDGSDSRAREPGSERGRGREKEEGNLDSEDERPMDPVTVAGPKMGRKRKVGKSARGESQGQERDEFYALGGDSCAVADAGCSANVSDVGGCGGGERGAEEAADALQALDAAVGSQKARKRKAGKTVEEREMEREIKEVR